MFVGREKLAKFAGLVIVTVGAELTSTVMAAGADTVIAPSLSVARAVSV